MPGGKIRLTGFLVVRRKNAGERAGRGRVAPRGQRPEMSRFTGYYGTEMKHGLLAMEAAN